MYWLPQPIGFPPPLGQGFLTVPYKEVPIRITEDPPTGGGNPG